MSKRKAVVVLRKMIPGTDWVVSSVTEIPNDLKYEAPQTFAERKMSDERHRARIMFSEFDKQEWKHVIMPIM